MDILQFKLKQNIFLLCGVLLCSGLLHSGEDELGTTEPIVAEFIVGSDGKVKVEKPAKAKKSKSKKHKSKKSSKEASYALLEESSKTLKELLAKDHGFEGEESLRAQIEQLTSQEKEALLKKIAEGDETTQSILKEFVTTQINAETVKTTSSLDGKIDSQNLKINTLEETLRLHKVVIACVCGVLLIVLLKEPLDGAIRTLISDPKKFFTTVWGSVPGPKQAKNFVATCIDYSTSLRDLVYDRANPKKAWRANPVRKLVGIVAPVAVVAGTAYAYRERETIKNASKSAGNKLKNLWSKRTSKLQDASAAQDGKDGAEDGEGAADDEAPYDRE